MLKLSSIEKNHITVILLCGVPVCPVSLIDPNLPPCVVSASIITVAVLFLVWFYCNLYVDMVYWMVMTLTYMTLTLTLGDEGDGSVLLSASVLLSLL